MVKISLAVVFMLQSFLVFSQSKLKDFIDGFPAMRLNVPFECANIRDLQVLNDTDGATYLSAKSTSTIQGYYKVGKITFNNGNTGLIYAVKAENLYTYAIDIMNKKGKVLDGYALGETYSTGGGSTFKITKEGTRYKVWKKSGTNEEDTFILGEVGIREW